jgi:hypothetical protein
MRNLDHDLWMPLSGKIPGLLNESDIIANFKKMENLIDLLSKSGIIQEVVFSMD